MPANEERPAAVTAVTEIAAWPEVAAEVELAREACTRLRWHEGLRRRQREAAAESRLRGAVASAELDGAVGRLDQVRDIVRGAATWPDSPDPVDLVVRGATRVTLETEHLHGVVLTSPLQALSRLHVAAGTGIVPDDAVGRPRLAGEDCLELTDLGAPPAVGSMTARLAGVVEVILALPTLPAVVGAAIVHAELVSIRPFVHANALVARAMDRLLLTAAGVDPTGVGVVERGHQAQGPAGYLGALAAYQRGDRRGVGLWLVHYTAAVSAGAGHGEQVAEAVRLGRLT